MVVVGDNSVSVEQPEGEPRQANINGAWFPPFFKIENVSSAKSLEVFLDDVIIATFPKCGTTWVQHIVCQLMIDTYVLAPGKELFTYTPLIEFVGGDVVNKLPRPRILKSHLNIWNIPRHDDAKCILVCRNPKDTLVSWFHHMRNIKGYNWEHGDFNVFFDMFCEGRIPWGGYFDYHKGWLPYFNHANVLVLKYEDLVKDLKAEIIKIGEFLGGKAVDIVSDPSRLQPIMDSASLESMKKDQKRWFPNVLRNPESFIRKAIPGDWRNYLSVVQSDRIDRMFEKNFQNTALDGWWKAEMEWK
uniref:Sulfotransfer_1 domain-containing protein n=1 Tax=Steinernema glaseri TaxID=37863 RepID=A0A1I7Y8I2_9BILA